MTDNEIIKALECCAKSKCKECSFNRHYDTKGTLCTLRLSEHALDLINRQKAEVERFKEIPLSVEIIKRIQDNIIKEFAERLKDNYNVIFGRKAVSIAEIDNLVKEMTEGNI